MCSVEDALDIVHCLDQRDMVRSLSLLQPFAITYVHTKHWAGEYQEEE